MLAVLQAIHAIDYLRSAHRVLHAVFTNVIPLAKRHIGLEISSSSHLLLRGRMLISFLTLLLRDNAVA